MMRLRLLALRTLGRSGLAAALAVGIVAATGSCGADSSEQTQKTVLSQDSPNLNPAVAPEAPVDPGTDLSGSTFDLFDGGSGAIGDYRGKPLVINFFASWCPPCVREMPDFQAVFERLDDQVAFLGLSQDRTADDALDLIESTGVTYAVGWDLDLEVYGATNSIAMPTTAFVSASGELLDVFSGALDTEALTEQIERVLGVSG